MRTGLDARAECIRIQAEDGTQAEIVPALGAIVSSLQFEARTGLRECLFRHGHFWDPASASTRGGIPLLFPVCGRVRLDGAPRYRWDGREYALPIHGLAMRRPWSVDAVARGHVEMSLRADAVTREAYPFAFSIRARFSACPGALEIRAVIQNEGDHAMPFSAGWHPYVLTPEAPLKDATLVDIPATAAGRYDETFARIAAWDAPLPFPVRPSHPRFCDTLHRAGAGAARVVWPDGFGVALEASDGGAAMPFWQLHTEPDKPYVCVEPWSSPPNALNGGEYLTVLPPGASRTLTLEVRREEI